MRCAEPGVLGKRSGKSIFAVMLFKRGHRDSRILAQKVSNDLHINYPYSVMKPVSNEMSALSRRRLPPSLLTSTHFRTSLN